MAEGLRGSIETADLTMVYRSGKVEVPALRDINLRVEPGEFVAIMGPSGCGKSTLLHLLGGLVRPTSGQVLIDGTDIARLTDAERTQIRREKVGYIFQRFNLLPNISAKANIELAKRIHGNGHTNLYNDDHLLALLGIKEKIGFRPTELSGGEQQRVAIARTLATGAQVLLADEPTGNLDRDNGGKVIEILGGLAHEQGYCVIIVTHDPSIAERSDKVWHMTDGVLQLAST
jgi:putative ABC transport system ATP-binding protein